MTSPGMSIRLIPVDPVTIKSHPGHAPALLDAEVLPANRARRRVGIGVGLHQPFEARADLAPAAHSGDAATAPPPYVPGMGSMDPMPGEGFEIFVSKMPRTLLR